MTIKQQPSLVLSNVQRLLTGRPLEPGRPGKPCRHDQRIILRVHASVSTVAVVVGVFAATHIGSVQP